MSTSTVVTESRAPLEDLLEHLPVSNILEYRKGQTIYGPEQPSKRFYLVTAGMVELSQVADGGSEILLDIVRPEESFGESAFHRAPNGSERAAAHENAKVMAWATSEIEDLIAKRPRLAVALLQILAARNAELVLRIDSLARDTIEQRLTRSLIRFSERLGEPDHDGSIRMLPLTHGLLSRYVATSREIISHHMNQLRKQGYVEYSRRGIRLYRDALKASLSEPGRAAAATSSQAPVMPAYERLVD